MNFGTSKPIQKNNSTSEADYSIDNAQEQQILQNINRLDGFFTENRGQLGNDSVRYYIQGQGVWFLDNGVVFEIQEPLEQTEVQRDPFDRFHHEFEPEMPESRKSVVLKLNFEGCNEVEPKGVGLLPHKNNYFYGNDSSKWCTNVPNYHEIIYENIYNNIDLRYYSNERGLKYDFIVHPDGDPDDIKMCYEGINELLIDSKNDLLIKTPIYNIKDTELFIYQNLNNNQIKIEGNFKILGPMTYTFDIKEEYDRSKDLIIDPIVYSTFIGGDSYDYGYDMAIDSNGNTYVTGRTNSGNFPNTTGVLDDTLDGNVDAYVLKLNPAGSSLIYSTFLGDTVSEIAYGIDVDASGNAYIVGHTSSSSFPTTPGAYPSNLGGSYVGFFSKINSLGTDLIYSTYFGGDYTEYFYDIVVDNNGNVYVTGKSSSYNFPVTTGAYDPTGSGIAPNNQYEGIIFKLDPSGNGNNDLLYSTYFGGADEDWGEGIKIDASGNIYVTGSTKSNDFPYTNDAFDKSYNGGYDCFILKLNPAGTGLSDLIYSTFITGSSDDQGFGIDIDSSNNAYITGYTKSTDFPYTSGAADTDHNGDKDAFVLKLNSAGTGLVYSTFIGGTLPDEGYDIAVDTRGSAYITGMTNSTDFPITSNANDTNHNYGDDAF
ncbi:MAG: SBBP repeat-containing protein, partial [Thermoplasmata archaeon]|nr:SBBP repeat-containing protein [Thermoplasmata archaeon]